MRTEKEIREMVETLQGIMDVVNEMRSPTLEEVVLPNVESFKDVLLWVLDDPLPSSDESGDKDE